MDRRNFIGSGTAALAGVSLVWGNRLWALDPEDPYMSKIGIQLYTLRNQMQADPKGTLQSVAKAGFKQIELMDVLGADSLVPIGKDLGLDCSSAFIQWNILGEEKPDPKVPGMDEVVAAAVKHGLKYLVFGYVGKGNRETAAQLTALAHRTNRAGELCKKAGIQLCYHHHSFEFAKLDNGKTGMDLLIEEFDPELVKFEIDVFWVAIGGWDPVKTLERLKGRVAQVHLKDLKPGTAVQYDEGKVAHEAFKEVGAGNIDMVKVIKTAKEIGVAQCHVEQDQSPDPVASIQLSMSNLRKI